MNSFKHLQTLCFLITFISSASSFAAAPKKRPPSPLRSSQISAELYTRFFKSPEYRDVNASLLNLLFPISKATPSEGEGDSDQPRVQLGEKEQKTNKAPRTSQVMAQQQSPSAVDLKKPLDQVSFDGLPEWNDWKMIQKSFVSIRDDRFMKDAQNLDRRPTWLYPDDGCYSRAEVMVERMKLQKAPMPKKIFAFGSLIVKTSNSYSGQVDWWYHVVVGFKHKGRVYVYDPAIETSQVLSLSDWLKRMGHPKDLSLTICETHSYGPTDPCRGKIESNFNQALMDQSEVFPLEWNRLEDLGRKPELELADAPPWKSGQITPAKLP